MYTHTHTHTQDILFSIRIWVTSVFKRIIEKDLMGSCQYRNIKRCRVVHVSYKDWKEGGKAWLMVEWFLILHGKTCFEISSQNL